MEYKVAGGETMIFPEGPENDEVEEEAGEGEAEGRCDIKCLQALKPECKCSCGGRNHGILRKVKEEEGERPLIYLGHSPRIAGVFDRCLVCGHDRLEVLAYPHEDGLYLKRYGMKLWIFGRCANCGAENAWWKYILRGSETVIAEPEVRVEGP